VNKEIITEHYIIQGIEVSKKDYMKFVKVGLLKE